MLTKHLTVIGLGAVSAEAQAVWRRHLPIDTFVTLQHPAASGRRLGRRSLGIGLDSLAVAAKALPRSRGRVLAMNPWPAAAARLSGAREVASVGLYSRPGSRSWGLLRRVLDDSPVLTTSTAETVAWQAAGGRAHEIVWGGTFGVTVPAVAPQARPRLFVGGTSDRDQGLVADLVAEVLSSEVDVHLVIADGSGPRTSRGAKATVEWLPFVSQTEFLAALQSCHVSYLPLKETGRAAGQMVLVASLEAGVPVLTTKIQALSAYEGEGVFVAESHDVLDRLLQLSHVDARQRLDYQERWRVSFSFESYVAGLASGLRDMDW